MKRDEPLILSDAFDVAPLECPEGIPDCGYLLELARLRTEVHRLTAMARTDELTGLYNFRHFGQALEVEMERTRRSGKPTALMVIDLDNFKQINDRYGHEFGNKVLRRVAGLLVHTVRRLDIACRYGGEEFTIILPDTSIRSAVAMAERLCGLIAGLVFESDAHAMSPTASFGVDVYASNTGETWQQFLNRADSHLLRAKREGKNRVCCPTPASPEGLSGDERDALMASVEAPQL